MPGQMTMTKGDGNAVATAVGTVLASTNTVATYTSSWFTNTSWSGVAIVWDLSLISASGTASMTLEIQGYDAVSAKAYGLLTGTAVTTAGTRRYAVGKDLAVSANAAASTYLPQSWRVMLHQANNGTNTSSIGYEYPAI